MLPAPARLTDSREFSATTRKGRRAGRSRLVVYVRVAGDERSAPARAGFVVSKAVGNAVVRHRVSRQLRHLMRDRLALLPPGATTVVRALQKSAGSTSVELGRDLDSALRSLGFGESR